MYIYLYIRFLKSKMSKILRYLLFYMPPQKENAANTDCKRHPDFRDVNM